MGLPIRTTVEDVTVVTKYLTSKPTGATVSDAKKVIDGRFLDGRKLVALKAWGLIEESAGGRYKVTDQGRAAAKGGEALIGSLRQAIRSTPAYMAIAERIAHKREESISATDVAAHWHAHFPDEASDNDKILNDQAVCFFQVLAGSALGEIKVGRKGYATRFDFEFPALTALVGAADEGAEDQENEVTWHGGGRPGREDATSTTVVTPPPPDERATRVFITHGRNMHILQQLKDIVTFGKFAPVVAQEHETVSKPLPDKVMDDMRSCFAGIIHVAGEQQLMDDKGNAVRKINENVLIEIGAAMALFGRNFILLVEKGVQLPSNLQGLYECRYEGEKLDGDATMKLLKAFNEFGRHR